MSVYVDVNVIVPLFALDPLNNRADKALRDLKDDLTVSDLCAAEFASVMARRVRTRDLRVEEARAAFSNFDSWCARYTQQLELERMDISTAAGLIRRLDLPLRTADAIHIAIVLRTACRLLTFDRTMASVARTLGVAIVRS